MMGPPLPSQSLNVEISDVFIAVAFRPPSSHSQQLFLLEEPSKLVPLLPDKFLEFIHHHKTRKKKVVGITIPVARTRYHHLRAI